jgi:predicted nucleic-acid-binding protein
MAEAALRIFEDAKKGKIFLLVTSITVAEVVWVLESFYGYARNQITETISQFLLCDGLEVQELDLLLNALTLYHEKNLDFADGLLASMALLKGPGTIYSFDHHLNRVSGVTVLEPS